MPRTAGAIISIGTWSSTKPDDRRGRSRAPARFSPKIDRVGLKFAPAVMSSGRPGIAAVQPLWAVEGGVVTVAGSGFPVDPLPDVRIGGTAARVMRASSQALAVVVPAGLDGGRTPIRVDGLSGETAFVEVG